MGGECVVYAVSVVCVVRVCGECGVCAVSVVCVSMWGWILEKDQDICRCDLAEDLCSAWPGRVMKGKVTKPESPLPAKFPPFYGWKRFSCLAQRRQESEVERRTEFSLILVKSLPLSVSGLRSLWKAFNIT